MGRRVKRQQVQSNDGWTVITHGLSNMSLDASEKKNKEDGGSLPSRIVDGLTVGKLCEEFEMLQDRWEGTSLARQVESILTMKEGGRGVEKGVVVGIGSFSRDWAHRWRSLWQLVLFVCVRDLLKRQDQEEGREIKAFAQDPAFTKLDEEFLNSLDVTVLREGLEGHIATTTFVFSPFVDWFLLLPRFLRDREPVLYVGNEILDDYGVFAQSGEKRERLEECNGIGKRWVERREMVRLGEFEKHGNALNGLVVYWRKEEEKEEEKEETTEKEMSEVKEDKNGDEVKAEKSKDA